MEKNTLFIIGNGFDLHHGLKTSTFDFCKKLSCKSVYGEICDAASVFAEYGIDWGKYEDSLKDLDLEYIEELKLSMPDYLSNHEYDRDGTILDMDEYLSSLDYAIRESLSEMVKAANDKLSDTNRDKNINNILQNGGGIISFNYTSTLEKLYEIEDVPILHIHGYYEDNEDLLFGYKEGKHAEEYRNRHFDPLDDSRDYYVDTQRESIARFYEGLKKELQINKLRTFLHDFKNIDQIYVMGHSMSYVDSDYMELIEKIFNPSVWYVSRFDGNPSDEVLRRYSFADKISIYSLDNLMDASLT